MLNESGQGFSVFRLLISAIMGLMILLIILGVYNYFEKIRIDLGYQTIVNGFENAVNKHDGTVILVDSAELPAGTEISSFSLSQGTGLDKDCIKITGQNSDVFSIASDNRLATMNHYAKLNIYIRCETNIEGCEIYCTVSLNKKIEAADI